ncbi:hypothetical protein [Bacillus atrophaeus]|nr:hypothetical protein [Bacillus atrophaeus]MCY8841075.1 hypothetical protein [Bacillus atrophaeus]MEC0805330.1 hypothetical protein [Bacillus atrophaeus]MEC0853246.1 hypothetical protein [Bacillus atrophaeus]MEC0856373.1 hypothetical protein [Bacillus atrophaeus]MEC0862965.1 hypothetical protein [Bacillus atrophaeus]
MPVLTEVIQLALLDQIYLICDCLVFVKIIINSSPPKRAINPWSGMAEERRFAVVTDIMPFDVMSIHQYPCLHDWKRSFPLLEIK